MTAPGQLPSQQPREIYGGSSWSLFEGATESCKLSSLSGGSSDAKEDLNAVRDKILQKFELDSPVNEQKDNKESSVQIDLSLSQDGSHDKSGLGDSDKNTQIGTLAGSPEFKRINFDAKNTSEGLKIDPKLGDSLPKRHMSLRLIPDGEEKEVKEEELLGKNGTKTSSKKKRSEDDIYEDELLKATNIVFELFE